MKFLQPDVLVRNYDVVHRTIFPTTFLNQEFYCRSASKEKEINLQRKLLDDTKKILHEQEQALLKEQALLNQRDDNILERLGYITHSEKRLEEEKLNLEDERKVLMEEKNKLDLKMQAIISREEVCIVSFPFISSRFVAAIVPNLLEFLSFFISNKTLLLKLCLTQKMLCLVGYN